MFAVGSVGRCQTRLHFRSEVLDALCFFFRSRRVSADRQANWGCYLSKREVVGVPPLSVDTAIYQ